LLIRARTGLEGLHLLDGKGFVKPGDGGVIFVAEAIISPWQSAQSTDNSWPLRDRGGLSGAGRQQKCNRTAAVNFLVNMSCSFCHSADPTTGPTEFYLSLCGQYPNSYRRRCRADPGTPPPWAVATKVVHDVFNVRLPSGPAMACMVELSRRLPA
jgi:hypothetical protein